MINGRKPVPRGGVPGRCGGVVRCPGRGLEPDVPRRRPCRSDAPLASWRGARRRSSSVPWQPRAPQRDGGRARSTAFRIGNTPESFRSSRARIHRTSLAASRQMTPVAPSSVITARPASAHGNMPPPTLTRPVAVAGQILSQPAVIGHRPGTTTNSFASALISPMRDGTCPSGCCWRPARGPAPPFVVLAATSSRTTDQSNVEGTSTICACATSTLVHAVHADTARRGALYRRASHAAWTQCQQCRAIHQFPQIHPQPPSGPKPRLSR